MPELPEVETVVRTLAPALSGAAILSVPHARADMVEPLGHDLAASLKGRRIASVTRRAKRIVFTLDSAERFFVHLGMTGQLTLEPTDGPRKKHTHLVVDIAGGRQLRLVDPRRFGAIVWLGKADHANVGPEPLSLLPEQLAKILGRTKRAVKTALLDQTLLAGVGNIYADEALHAAGIDPRRPGNSLSTAEAGRLNRALKTVLRNAIRAGGSSIRDYVDANGKRGDFQARHRVYDREGKPCHKCRGKIIRIVLGGRSTHYCADCQS